MEASQETLRQEMARGRMPFDFGIKELKRVLNRMGMSKSEKNRTIKMYKDRLYTRVEEVREKMESELLPDKDKKDASDK